MIDIHTHLLPGVDDGARTFAESLAALQALTSDGVRRIVCTPHLRASQAAEAPRVRNDALRAELQHRVGGVPALELGWEIMLDRPGVDLTAPELRLGASRAVLVEFPHGGVPPGATAELRRIRESGVVPVLAHPERYWGCSVTHAREWRAAGAVLQGDATFLLGSGDKGRLARSLLALGLLDLLASDNHGDRRSLRGARDWLCELGAGDAAELLTGRNAAHLLADEPLEPVPPVVVDRSLARRLRELLFGRA
ncbi:MAG TPA: CpsB/CapC family capsule biosynthesis tyrosine phosphatase [Gemmatimonadaceae bacterium]|nr:CpsB/CapC family capsule biosynthesis tyrosine phosphatase [Gemmatimonadaceae bacterium]